MRVTKSIVIGAALALTLAACSGKEQRYAQHMKKAQDFYAKQDFDKAMVEARNAIQVSPRAAEPMHLAGLIDEGSQNWQRAYANYNRALELDPKFYPSQIRIARINLMARDAAQAEKRIGEVLAARPDDADARAVNAQILASKGEHAKAAIEAAKVLETAPGHVDASNLAGALLLQQNDSKKALALLEKSIAANPSSVEIRGTYNAVLARVGDIAKLESNLKALVELAPKRFEHRAGLALFYAQSQQSDKAEQVLREAIAANKDEDPRYIALIDLITSRQGVDPAIKELQGFITARPKAHPLRFKLAQLYNTTARPQEAIKVYEEIISVEKTGPAAQQARLLLANNYVVTARRAEAEKLVGEVLKENSRDNAGLVARAQFSMAKKDWVGAINDLRAVMKDQPGSVQVVSLLANAHRMNKEVELGREVITSAIKLVPQSKELKLLQADYQFATGNAAASQRELDDLIKQEPKYVRAYEAKAALQVRNKDLAGAERTFAALKTALPENAIGAYRLGLTYIAQKKFDPAIREFEAALTQSPNSREVIAALVSAYARQGKLDQAVGRTQKLAKEQPKNFLPQLILGDIHTAQKKFAEAEAAFEKARELNPKASAVYLGMSRMYAARGQRDKAGAILEDARKSIPNDPSLLLALGEVYQRVGDSDKAIEQYETIVKRNPGNDIAANNLAYLLAEKKGDKTNLDRALTLAKRFEESPNAAFLDTIGWIYFKRGENDQALGFLQKAHDQFPNSPSFMYHLGAALLKSGDKAQGRALLLKAIESAEDFGNREEAKKLLGTV